MGDLSSEHPLKQGVVVSPAGRGARAALKTPPVAGGKYASPDPVLAVLSVHRRFGSDSWPFAVVGGARGDWALGCAVHPGPFRASGLL